MPNEKLNKIHPSTIICPIHSSPGASAPAEPKKEGESTEPVMLTLAAARVNGCKQKLG